MATRMTFTAQGLGDIAKDLATSPELLIATTNDGLRAIGRLFVPSKGTGPLADATPQRTGKLAKSTFFQITGPPTSQILTILQPARSPAQYDAQFYGSFVRDGTRAHIIRPRFRKVLRFESKGGDIVFTAAVRHPGTSPNPYHTRLLTQQQGEIQSIVTRMRTRVQAHFA